MAKNNAREIEIFSENGKYGAKDRKTGEIILNCEYDAINYYPGLGDWILVKKNSKWGCVDYYGKLLVPIEYDDINLSDERRVVATKDGKTGYIYMDTYDKKLDVQAAIDEINTTCARKIMYLEKAKESLHYACTGDLSSDSKKLISDIDALIEKARQEANKLIQSVSGQKPSTSGTGSVGRK